MSPLRKSPHVLTSAWKSGQGTKSSRFSSVRGVLRMWVRARREAKVARETGRERGDSASSARCLPLGDGRALLGDTGEEGEGEAVRTGEKKSVSFSGGTGGSGRLVRGGLGAG